MKEGKTLMLSAVVRPSVSAVESLATKDAPYDSAIRVALSGLLVEPDGETLVLNPIGVLEDGWPLVRP